MIKDIIYNGELIAKVFKNSEVKQGLNFITSPEESLQIGILNHPKGHIIQPHVHNIVERKIDKTQEMLYVEKGKMRVDFLGKNGEKIAEEILEAGDLVALLKLGHGMEILEDAKIIYTKQGPYMGKEADKVVFGEK